MKSEQRRIKWWGLLALVGLAAGLAASSQLVVLVMLQPRSSQRVYVFDPSTGQVSNPTGRGGSFPAGGMLHLYEPAALTGVHLPPPQSVAISEEELLALTGLGDLLERGTIAYFNRTGGGLTPDAKSLLVKHSLAIVRWSPDPQALGQYLDGVYQATLDSAQPLNFHELPGLMDFWSKSYVKGGTAWMALYA